MCIGLHWNSAMGCAGVQLRSERWKKTKQNKMKWNAASTDKHIHECMEYRKIVIVQATNLFFFLLCACFYLRYDRNDIRSLWIRYILLRPSIITEWYVNIERFTFIWLDFVDDLIFAIFSFPSHSRCVLGHIWTKREKAAIQFCIVALRSAVQWCGQKTN